MEEKEIETLKQFCKERLGENFDLFDFKNEIDRTLTLQEAKDELRDKINLINPNSLEPDIKEIKNDEIKYKMYENDFKRKWLKENNPIQRKNLDKFKTIAIYGDIGTGKTAIAYKILEQYKDKPIFFIKHPKPELIRQLGYANLRSLEDLERVNNCVVYFDEPQLNISIYDKKANRIIARLCSLARQRNITLIISSSDTRVFNKSNESYFELWIIKDVDYFMVKNGSKIKKAIKENAILEPDGFRLELNEYLVENRKMPEINGKHEFELSKLWNEEHSKPYEIANKTAKEN